MDKKNVKYSGDLVSPYLRRPLRSLADALADRARPAGPALQVTDYAPANDDGRSTRPALNHRG